MPSGVVLYHPRGKHSLMRQLTGPLAYACPRVPPLSCFLAPDVCCTARHLCLTAHPCQPLKAPCTCGA